MADINTQKILVIEDEEPMRDALHDTLTQEGYIVLTSENGQEGIELALQEKPSLILMDIFMPKLDGLTMLQQLRSDAWGKDVPVIILTNLNPDADATIKAIMDDKPAFYLIKSNVTLEGIVENVKEVLNK